MSTNPQNKKSRQIRIDDDLHRQLKIKAARSRSTLGDLIIKAVLNYYEDMMAYEARKGTLKKRQTSARREKAENQQIDLINTGLSKGD